VRRWLRVSMPRQVAVEGGRRSPPCTRMGNGAGLVVITARREAAKSKTALVRAAIFSAAVLIASNMESMSNKVVVPVEMTALLITTSMRTTMTVTATKIAALMIAIIKVATSLVRAAKRVVIKGVAVIWLVPLMQVRKVVPIGIGARTMLHRERAGAVQRRGRGQCTCMRSKRLHSTIRTRGRLT
jgi:hypothetical protein